MRFAFARNLIIQPGLQHELSSVRDLEDQHDVTAPAPVVGDVSGTVLDHANAKVPRFHRAPRGQTTRARVLDSGDLAPVSDRERHVFDVHRAHHRSDRRDDHHAFGGEAVLVPGTDCHGEGRGIGHFAAIVLRHAKRIENAMQIDRGAFFLCLSSISAGAVGGYVASEKDVVPHLVGSSHAPASKTEVSSAPARAEPPAAPVVAAAPAVEAAPAPACDDSVGEPAACPQMGAPTAEGGAGCGGLAVTRCNDFKQAMKPRVAQAAVACLNKLSGGERCDPKRVELCGHLALMNACDDPAAASTIAGACERIVQTCGASPLAPSQNECRLAMSGLREVGRDAMLDCAKKHCFDKGLLGCEAVAAPRP